MNIDWRTPEIDALTDLDVLIIGGGIVGAGIARDAAMRGLRVGLAEQYDFAAGTSSRSSRLLHGGIRYLAQGDLRLVREASVEKRTLSKIAPHLADPLAFIFPTFSDQKDWHLWQLKIGVKLYDALCGWRNLGSSQWLHREQVTGAVPGIRSDALTGAVRYYDGLTNDARLVFDTLKAAKRHGSHLVNHLRFERAERSGEAWSSELTDKITGQTIRAKAKWLVSAAGAWSDKIPGSVLSLRLTKGVHLVIPHERLPVADALVMTEGRRVLFAIPWGKRTILGTTDTDLVGRVEDVRCEAADQDYILSIANRTFPDAHLTPNDVISTWAGVRPLIAEKSGAPSDISRAHEIRLMDHRWLEIGGGKLTTYRLIAEQAVDRIIRDLIGHRVPCHTADELLICAEEAAGISAVVPLPVSQAAVERYCREEWALHLSDVMIRRSSWHYYLENPHEAAAQVANWMAASLGWDPQQLSSELQAYHAIPARCGPANHDQLRSTQPV